MSIDNLTIRPACESDLQAILDIYNFYIATSTALWDYEGISVHELREHIPIGDGKYDMYMLCLDAEVAGFCSLKQYRKKEAYYRTAEIGLYLKKEFTGRGLGREAVGFLENVSARKKIRVPVASISGEKVASIKLFEKMGYQQYAHYREVGEKFGRTLDIC
jgi:L-amino acid N-acyltransferase YncA